MDILQFVKKHLGEHKKVGNEIQVKVCPFCNKSKHKFSINTEKGVYQCFSGSCRATGHISKLYEKYNETLNIKFNSKKMDILQYAKPTNANIIEFFKTRGISEDTIKHNFFDVMSTVNKEISFIYRKKFEVHSIKIRSITEKKFHGKKYNDFTLWKLDYCDTDKPLIIVEGEIDQLSYEEQKIQNVVSVPSGVGNLAWIDTDFEELEKYKTIILALDNDKAGKEATAKIIKRLPEECDIKIIDYINFKDANEIHLDGGDLQDYIDNASDVEDNYIIKMQDISLEETKRYSTGIKSLNKSTGGVRRGEVSIWTGKAGSGKSSIINQIMLNVMNQNIKAMIYSPELTDKQYKDWTCRQLLIKTEGSFDKSFCKVRGKDVFTIKGYIADKMSNWVDKWLVNITNSKKLTNREVLKLIKRDIKKNDVKFIVIDNLMKIMFENETGINDFALHKEFINDLSEIAKTYNVCINLVAHPKKHDETEPDQYDIAGTSNIPNLVDNIYYVRRVTKWGFKNDLKDQEEEYTQKGIKTLIMILKSREGERIGEWLEFCFDINRKSIYDFNEGKEYITKWQEIEVDDKPEIFRGLE